MSKPLGGDAGQPLSTLLHAPATLTPMPLNDDVEFAVERVLEVGVLEEGWPGRRLPPSVLLKPWPNPLTPTRTPARLPIANGNDVSNLR